MAPTPHDQYVGKKIILTVNLKEANEKGELAEEIEGTLEAANAMGLMVKPKGQVKARIIELSDIEGELRLAPTKEKALTARKIKPVQLGQAKSHLLERHGFRLQDVNAMSEEEAYNGHAKIDHVADNLGHVHVDKSDAPKADEAGEQAADSTPDA